MTIDQVRHLLRCPVCASPFLTQAPAPVLRCPRGHAFDIARHGYVNLLTGKAPAGAETPAMVAARADLLAAGPLDPVAQAVIDAVTDQVPTDEGVDAGAGTGHYLAAVLDARPATLGIAVDVAKAAARHSARAHPRIASVVADVWRGLPLVDGCAAAVLNIFAPRNAAEFHRVLRPDGLLVVVTPTVRHLGELVTALGLLSVDPAKTQRLAASLERWFTPAGQHPVAYPLALTRDAAAQFVAMGPSSWHVDADQLAGRLAALPEPVAVTVSVMVNVYRPRLATRRG
jgi:23S rRNA (guanine745-N1)-methyltransferase